MPERDPFFEALKRADREGKGRSSRRAGPTSLPELLRELDVRSVRWTRTKRGHVKIFAPRGIVITSGTPGGGRWAENLLGELRRNGLDLREPHGRGVRATRGRAAAKQRLDYIARTDPTGWADTPLRAFFLHRVRALFGLAPRGRMHERLEAEVPPSPVDGLLVWLWREGKRGFSPQGSRPFDDSTMAPPGSPERQQRNAQAAALDPGQNLIFIRDWFLATHPDLFRFTAAQAAEAALAWEHHQEVKRTRAALKKAIKAFPVEVLRGPWGVWRLREPSSSPLAPVMAIGKMLGHCYQHEWHARHYGEGGPLAILFGKDGWPKVGVALKLVDRNEIPSRFGSVRADQLQAYEIKGLQNVSVPASDPYAPAVAALLRRLVSKEPSSWWGPGLAALKHVPLSKLIDLDEEDLNALEGLEAARVIKGLLYGGSDAVQFPSGLTERSWELNWDLQGRWPQGGDWPAVAWLKPYRPPRGVSPAIVTITLTADENMGWVMDGEDSTWQAAREGNKHWLELEEAAERQRRGLGGGGVRELLQDHVDSFQTGWPRDERGPYHLLRSWEQDEQITVEVQIDARRLIRHAEAWAAKRRRSAPWLASTTGADYVTAELTDLLEKMVRTMEWYQGGSHSIPRFDELYSAIDHAIEWARLKWIEKDEKAAAAYRAEFAAKNPPPKPLGRSARRRGRRR